MTITSDVQSLHPGGLFQGFELDATSLGAGLVRFHGYTDSGNVTWQGNVYAPWPIIAANFQRTTDQQPTPTITAGNIDGSLSALCISFDDLIGAKFTRRRTLVKYLDAVNFEGGNANADPTQYMPDEIWYVERKASEDSEAVQWELSSALDLDGQQLPGRPIIANVCSWLSIGGYRGPNCGYTGPPVAQADDSPTTDPTLDKCGGRISSCKSRFGAKKQLPYGSFPAAGLLRQ